MTDSTFFTVFLLVFLLCSHWIFTAVRRLSLAVAGAGCSLVCCAAFSLLWFLLSQSTGTRAPVVVECGPRCSETCGIFLDQGSNPCPLHWLMDSYHQGSPVGCFYNIYFYLFLYLAALGLGCSRQDLF